MQVSRFEFNAGRESERFPKWLDQNRRKFRDGTCAEDG